MNVRALYFIRLCSQFSSCLLGTLSQNPLRLSSTHQLNEGGPPGLCLVTAHSAMASAADCMLILAKKVSLGLTSVLWCRPKYPAACLLFAIRCCIFFPIASSQTITHLVSYTNSHSGSHRFLGPEVQAWLSWVPRSGSSMASIKLLRAVLSPGGLTGGRIHFQTH